MNMSDYSCGSIMLNNLPNGRIKTNGFSLKCGLLTPWNIFMDP